MALSSARSVQFVLFLVKMVPFSASLEQPEPPVSPEASFVVKHPILAGILINSIAPLLVLLVKSSTHFLYEKYKKWKQRRSPTSASTSTSTDGTPESNSAAVGLNEPLLPTHSNPSDAPRDTSDTATPTDPFLQPSKETGDGNDVAISVDQSRGSP